MYSRLYNYFKRKIVPVQHGFLAGRSVETNLCTFLNYSMPIVQSRGQVDAVYLDMSKAFDRVNHELLLLKLNNYGLGPEYISWFRSYLHERQNRVRVSGYLSRPFISISGVPQGSNLGPLLFNIFVNDLISSVKHSQVLIFADDVKLFRQVDCIADCTLLQEDVLSVQKWCISNNLLLNPRKTQVMSLSRRRNTLSYDYTMDIEPISRTKLVRDLGVFVDEHLSFNSHINSIVSQSIRALGIMARLTKPFSNHHCLLRLYSTHVRSKLEFASVVWNNISSSASESIERVQRRVVRIIYDRYFGRKFYFEYNLILTRLGLCTLCNRRSIRDVKFLHKLVHGSIDSSTLLASLHFRIPVNTSSRNRRVFYPDHLNLSPVSRIQHVLNTKYCGIDIFCTTLPHMFYTCA